MAASEWTEETLVEWLTHLGWPRHRFVQKGIGDDCAVCRPTRGFELLVSTDVMVEGRHFHFSSMSPFDLGWKLGASTLSDIAAMGGIPVAFFLSASFPAETVTRFQSVILGLQQSLAQWKIPLAGGDISAGSQFYLSATVLGEVPTGRALRRQGARPGDWIYVTGSPGYASAGFRLLQEGYRLEGDNLRAPGGAISKLPLRKLCVQKHIRPEAQISAAWSLRQCGAVTSAMDTSDGLIKDLGRMCSASGVGARLYQSTILQMQRAGIVTQEDVLGGGEDYELLFTVRPEGEDALCRVLRRCGMPLASRIGMICAAHPRTVTWLTPRGEEALPSLGYDHLKAPTE